MTVILDLDQDFFFYPRINDGISGKDSEDNKLWRVNNQKQLLEVETFINKYQLKNYNYVIFRNHSQVYYYLKNFYGKIDKLLHFDAHSDIDDSNDKWLGIGNWVEYVINDGICHDIDWITMDTNDIGDVYKKAINKTIKAKTSKDVEYNLSVSDFYSHFWEESVSELLITISPEFVPHSNIINELINII